VFSARFSAHGDPLSPPATQRCYVRSLALLTVVGVLLASCAAPEGAVEALDRTQQTPPSVPNTIPEPQSRVVSTWLQTQPQLRVAEEKDAYNLKDAGDRPDTKRVHVENADNANFHVSADLNRDGLEDFAVVLVDRQKEKRNSLASASGPLNQQALHAYFSAAIAVFNGPFRAGQAPAFFQESIGVPSGSLLWLRDGGLCIGPPESGCGMLVPTRTGYSLQPAP